MKKVVFIFIIIFIVGVAGCSKHESSSIQGNLVYESMISPNEEYIKDDKDKVILEVKVYQDQDNKVIVTATDNTEFFEEKSYSITYNKRISKSDIKIEWTTLMGNDKSSKENQKVVATIKIFDEDKLISERKINFAKNAMDIVTENVNLK